MDVGTPRGVEYTRNFARIVQLSHTPEWSNKVWRAGGKTYDRRGDFREISDGELPVIIHQGNRFNRKAGDKVELIETGPMTVLDMVSIVQSLYQADALEHTVMRLDLAADVPGLPVQWWRNNTYVGSKQVMREWAVANVSSRRAETLTAGNKPNQIRIYDKTRHRRVLLNKELRRLSKADRHLGMSFEDRWGYSETDVVTRVERQIGGKSALERFGFTKVGYLYKVDDAEPFNRMVFPRYNEKMLKGEDAFVRLNPEQRVMANYLRGIVERDGLTHARNHLFNMCKQRTQFYRLWKRYRPLIALESKVIPMRPELLQRSFLGSMSRQLQRAA